MSENGHIVFYTRSKTLSTNEYGVNEEEFFIHFPIHNQY
jgi:hypothetical protein